MFICQFLNAGTTCYMFSPKSFKELYNIADAKPWVEQGHLCR